MTNERPEWRRRDRTPVEAPLTREVLKVRLDVGGVDERTYSLYGAHENDRLVLLQMPGGRWRVFYFERGSEYDNRAFDSEDDA